jgi:SAM-dependent methyltransferase
VCSAEVHLEGELTQQQRFQGLVDTTRRFAPSGKCDIGCGTGTFIHRAQTSGIVCEGIELTPERRSLARKHTGATVYDRPLELLNLTPESFAAVTLVNVFSHLTCPTETFSHIHRVLARGGVMMMHTGEIGEAYVRPTIFHGSWEIIFIFSVKTRLISMRQNLNFTCFIARRSGSPGRYIRKSALREEAGRSFAISRRWRVYIRRESLLFCAGICLTKSMWIIRSSRLH